MMGMFNNSLSLWIILNTCNMSNVIPFTELSNLFERTSRSIICFNKRGNTNDKKTSNKCCITWFVHSPAKGVVHINDKKVSIVTWRKDKRPNFGIWVTSICQISFDWDPRGLIPWGIERICNRREMDNL